MDKDGVLISLKQVSAYYGCGTALPLSALYQVQDELTAPSENPLRKKLEYVCTPSVIPKNPPSIHGH